MSSPRLVIAAVALSVTSLFSGCGSSGSAPVMQLSILTSSPLASGELSVPYNANLTATGGVAPYAWNLTSGTLPPGVGLNSSGSLSGTPTAPSTYSFSVSVTDSQRSPSTTSTNLSITIVPALQITTTSLSNSSVGLFYNSTLAVTGGFPAYTWSITQGSLPSGLTLNATTGLISGTPTVAGTSTFTVKLTDSGTPATVTTAILSIAITPPPAKGAALYVSQGSGGPPGPAWDQTGLQIQIDGSLTLLPSSPESAINGSNFAVSPTLPLIFVVSTTTGAFQSLLVNPDYSLASYSTSGPLPASSVFFRPSVDPTGSNVYYPGPIDASGTLGVTVFPGDGSLQTLGSVAIPNSVALSQMVFTPDGKLAFIRSCISVQGNILSYSRANSGMLTAAATVATAGCGKAIAVSSDGKYLATADVSDVQVYGIASDGTLTPVLAQPFTVTLGPNATESAEVTDIVWDQSSGFLIVGTIGALHVYDGGLGVLSLLGNVLSQTVDPTGGGAGRILRTGSFVYGMRECNSLGCIGPFGIIGFDFQNGQLIPLPGSPFPYGNGGDMVIY